MLADKQEKFQARILEMVEKQNQLIEKMFKMISEKSEKSMDEGV